MFIIWNKLLSKYYNKKGKKCHKKALEYFNKAIELDNENAEAYYNRAEKSIFEEYLKPDFNPNDTVYLEKALSDCNNAIRFKQNFWQAYDLRAKIKCGFEDFHSALDDCNISIKLNPSNSDIIAGRGMVKSKLKDYFGAIEDYTKAIELEPEIYFNYFERGLNKFRLCDVSGAIEDFENAFKVEKITKERNIMISQDLKTSGSIIKDSTLAKFILNQKELKKSENLQIIKYLEKIERAAFV